MDIWAGHDFYQSHQPLNVKNDKVFVLPRLGVTVFQSASNKLKISVETGVFRRQFYQEFTGEEFRYKFLGWSTAPVVSYKAFNSMYLDAGMTLLFYHSRINGYGLTSPIGDGFRGYDIGFIAGGTYYFKEWFSVGVRYTPYFYKMLKYKRISEYGDFEPSKNDISTQRLEFFVRFQILNSMNR